MLSKTRLAAILAASAMAMGIAAPIAHADEVKAMKQQAEKSLKQKVVFQVSEGDPKTWNLALNNAKNVQTALGNDKAEIEIVVYGPGIGMLKMDSPVGNRIGEAVDSGVKVVACENTMRGQKLTKEDMLPTIGYVPAGVIELMKKQQEGYSYIRP